MAKVETGCTGATNSTPKNSTTLITFNENRIPQNNRNCKLKLNLLSKFLFVLPKNENFNDIMATFDWKFIRSKNILFVFANFDFQDFVLAFKNEETCITVFNGIFKNRDVDFVENKLLEKRLLNPLFKNASQNLKLKKILEEWIQKFGEKEKNEYLQLLKWHQENPEINDNNEDIKDVKPEIKPLPKRNRKRKHRETEFQNLSDSVKPVEQNIFDGMNDCDDESEEYQFTKIIDKSKFEIVRFQNGKRFCRKLLIFTSPNKTQYYECSFRRSKKYFYHRCRENLKGIKAVLDRDENGNECIKMEDKRHRCSPLFYEPKIYEPIKIVKKPDYEILENCETRSGRMLIIFDPNDRSQCFEFHWSLCRKTFYCRSCTSKRKRWIRAEIYQRNIEIEYVLFSADEHVCEMKKYNPAKYFSRYVFSPNFEIQYQIRYGLERKTLIIFDKNDRKCCYVYSYRNFNNDFFCAACRRKHQKCVSAKICKNNEKEEYVCLSSVKHLCSPRNYISQNEMIILRPPQFKFIEASKKFASKIFIFDSTEPELCYTFSQYRKEKRYSCLGCKTVVAQQKNGINKNNKIQTTYRPML